MVRERIDLLSATTEAEAIIRELRDGMTETVTKEGDRDALWDRADAWLESFGNDRRDINRNHPNRRSSPENLTSRIYRSRVFRWPLDEGDKRLADAYWGEEQVVARGSPTELSCIGCGKTFKSYVNEARHRHNFPLLCRHKPELVRCAGTNKDGTQCGKMTRRKGGKCSYHSHQGN